MAEEYQQSSTTAAGVIGSSNNNWSAAGINDMLSYGAAWTTPEINTATATATAAEQKVGVTGGLRIDPSFSSVTAAFGLSSPTIDWNNLLLSVGRDDQNHGFHTMYRQDSGTVDREMKEDFLLDRNLALGSTTHHDHCTFPPMMAEGYPTVPMYEPSDHILKPQVYDELLNLENGRPPPPSPWYAKFQQQQAGLPSTTKQRQAVGQLHFSDTAGFWNAPAAEICRPVEPGSFPPVQSQFFPQGFQTKPNYNSTTNTTKPSKRTDGARDQSTKKGGVGNEPTSKKPRMETPSPLPTFKVRKEKLSDRITALQQLVSPFGKTDTASVLFEAIEYIKFVHDQVNVLTTPYLKNGHPMQQQQQQQRHQQNHVEKASKDKEGPKQDLRSQGLCLVPLETAALVINECASDFWNPTFGGSYR